MLRRLLLFSVFWITLIIPKIDFAQTIPTFNCPTMVGLLNEGPSEPEQPSYISVINPSSGLLGTQIAVTDITTSASYKSLNGIGLVNTDGYAYAQYTITTIRKKQTILALLVI